jgi:hypothetical protein
LVFITQNKKGRNVLQKGRNVKNIAPFFMFLILISFFLKIVQKMNKGRKGRNKVKIGVP